MSKPSCDACSNLREYNANFIMNGVTDDIAASLANNTGLNACLTDLHTDCEDLNDVNDCLIGHMDDDVDNYEVCDWKSLMHNFFPNLYETLKAMIASICGLWTKVDKISDSLCAYITGEWTQLPASVGTHFCNDSEYWDTTDHDGTHYSPLRASLTKKAVKVCDDMEILYISVVMVNNPGDPGYNNIIKKLDGRLVEYTKDELVPSFFTESQWDKLISAVPNFGGFPSTVLSLQSGSYDVLIEYKTDEQKLILFPWGVTGDGIGGASPTFPIEQYYI